MGKRSYTIKQTKSSSFAVSYFELSKGVVQASSLGLRPARPDFDSLLPALEKSGDALAYELGYDAGRLSFEVRLGKKSTTLATAQISAFKTLKARREVMRQLLNYGLVKDSDMPPSEADVAEAEKQLATARAAEKRAYVRMREMEYERSLTDLSADNVKRFRAWARAIGLGRHIDALDAAGPGNDAGRSKVLAAIDKHVLPMFYRAEAKRPEFQHARLERAVAALEKRLEALNTVTP
ncbi:MAG: hypothetical protein K8R60_05535 [Burkholderiales bacterium]|nr:hypothetical protein [Burkholderiales bacterium]